MSTWEREQERLQRAIVHEEWFNPPITGMFHDRRPQPHRWLRVIEAGRYPETGERYLCLQIGGTGASWWKEMEIDLFPDEPAP